MLERALHYTFHIDTNRINAKQKLLYMNLLEKWHEAGIITLIMPEPAHEEACDSPLREKKALGYMYSKSFAETSEELALLKKVESILFPDGAKNSNQANDVEIVFIAIKYHRILITNDGGSKTQPGGILGNAPKLEKLGLRVMRDSEASEYVKRAIDRRDLLCKKIAALTGEKLPDWVGLD